jgi:hypothetical protein
MSSILACGACITEVYCSALNSANEFPPRIANFSAIPVTDLTGARNCQKI